MLNHIEMKHAIDSLYEGSDVKLDYPSRFTCWKATKRSSYSSRVFNASLYSNLFTLNSNNRLFAVSMSLENIRAIKKYAAQKSNPSIIIVTSHNISPIIEKLNFSGNIIIKNDIEFLKNVKKHKVGFTAVVFSDCYMGAIDRNVQVPFINGKLANFSHLESILKITYNFEIITTNSEGDCIFIDKTHAYDISELIAKSLSNYIKNKMGTVLSWRYIAQKSVASESNIISSSFKLIETFLLHTYFFNGEKKALKTLKQIEEMQ